ncbi:cyanophycinase [Phormidium sp. CLA17]|uniref:cyanophycinase n=1 Tax=Leptolyngbya sp. Cla-17 TaxID=2803751 RepID=UPI0014913C95|nr:cyanophycinase [Leptolyngbya sp. Cla-17]MBM0741497.1 cyanophycinase [Leptolyngbya sp. Cla-17]
MTLQEVQEVGTASQNNESEVQDSVALPETHGQLVIIGGAEDKEGDCKILREFVRRAGGLQARIVVMTVATGLPGEVGETYINVFQRLGADSVKVVDTAKRENADDPKGLEAIQDATGVFFTGGNQARITECLKDTELDSLLHRRFSEGIIIAGTSAGAAMMPDMMIVEGESETNPRMDVAEMDRGMGFFTGVVIDQHFAQRGRLGRLLSAIAQQPVNLGFGIDENTAIIINGKELEVFGEGAITVVDVANLTHTNVDKLLKDEPLALCNATLHILPHGYGFNLEKRTPIERK